MQVIQYTSNLLNITCINRNERINCLPITKTIEPTLSDHEFQPTSHLCYRTAPLQWSNPERLRLNITSPRLHRCAIREEAISRIQRRLPIPHRHKTIQDVARTLK